MMDTMRHLQSEENNAMDYEQLSDAQEKILAILPIPSALLSICGGLIMITAAPRSRGERPWTPYQGLMTSLSFCNILSSLTVATGAFMYPSATSNQVWAFGNGTSCIANGFFGQLSVIDVGLQIMAETASIPYSFPIIRRTSRSSQSRKMSSDWKI